MHLNMPFKASHMGSCFHVPFGAGKLSLCLQHLIAVQRDVYYISGAKADKQGETELEKRIYRSKT